MNPFLEWSWTDVHTRLIGYICDELAGHGLPAGLRARAEENLVIEEFSRPPQAARADVAVLESWQRGIPPSWVPEGDARPAVKLATPKYVMRVPEIERWLEISSVHGKLITVIEMFSLSNKTGDGRERYLRKRRIYEEGGVNLVEIDLLRGGLATVTATAGSASDLGLDTLYTICVTRASQPNCCEVYHWGLRDPIPAMAVPLRVEDADATLDLQPLVNRAYEMGYYWQENFAGIRLEPKLTEDERAFADECLRAAGLLDG